MDFFCQNLGLHVITDVLININGKQAYDFKLPEINRILHGKTGKPIRLRIERNGQNMLFKFRLDDAFKINEPSNWELM